MLTPQTNATLEEIAELLKRHDAFAICGHVSPDGDCVGSQLALKWALESLGKQVTCLLVRDEPLSADVAFMPGAEGLVPASAITGAPDVFIGVDVPTRERIGEAACAVLDAAKTSVTLDHHASVKRMCEHAYIDPDSASASVIAWKLVKLLCDVPPLESATCAYAGLFSDTGGFRYQNADTDAFATAAELSAFGVDTAYVAMKTTQCRSLASVKLESRVIERIEIGRDGAYAMSYATQRDFDEVGAVKADAEPLIDAIRQLDGIRIACMLRAQDGKVRGSLRAKDDTDISVLARELGGGGHAAAAGFTLEMPIEDAVPFMKRRLEDSISHL